MDNKFNNMLNDFFESLDVKDKNELNDALGRFIEEYNSGNMDYENTPLDDAYELLEKAECAKNDKEALKLARSAYKKCPECFEALLFQVSLEDNSLKRFKLLDEGLEVEKKRLEKEKFFVKDNIGKFFGLFGTRPYICGLFFKANLLCLDGKLKQAMDVCKEILRLNNDDNIGARYLLMAIYAFFEDEKSLLELCKKYKENNFEVLFPLFALYYKLGNDKKAKEYLDKINKENPNFVKYFKGNLKFDKKIFDGCFTIGDASEIFMYFHEHGFLTDTIPNIDDYVLDYFKNKK